jgi:hypothetical protein
LVRGCCPISWDQQRKAGRKARAVKDPLWHPLQPGPQP